MVDAEMKTLLYEASFQAFERIVDYALEEGASFVLIAGDIYDSVTRSLRAQLHFRNIAQRAGREGLNFYVVHGNHDPLNSWTARVPFPDNVIRFGEDLSSVTHYAEGIPLARIWGVSYSRRETSENLALRFRNLPDQNDLFSIGMLHCNVGGVSALHKDYAPCTMKDLLDVPVDYWALGHVHEKEILHDSSPVVVYPGNIQGRHINEQGDKGCFLVSVASGRVEELEFLPSSELVWMEKNIELEAVEGITDIYDMLESACESTRSSLKGRAAIVRFSLRGEKGSGDLPVNPVLLDQIVQTFREREKKRLDMIWIEAIRTAPQPRKDPADSVKGGSFLADFLEVARQARQDPSFVEDILRSTPGFYKVRSLLGEKGFLEYEEMIDQAEKMGLSRLLEED